MRIVRYQLKGDAPRYGWLHNGKIGPIEGDIFGDFIRLEAEIPLDKARLLAPLRPGKIICVGRNYVAHAEEHDAAVPQVPLIFLKPPSAVIGPQETILLPPQSQRVEHEGELVAVIGRRGRHILAEETADYLLGYTIGNDITARDLQRSDGQWTRGKGFDTFAPLGPWIDTEFDPADALITVRVNGELRQMGATRDMVFSVPALVAFISSVMTLEAGDVIYTGTPSGVGPLHPADVVTVEIENLGLLENPVAAE